MQPLPGLGASCQSRLPFHQQLRSNLLGRLGTLGVLIVIIPICSEFLPTGLGFRAEKTVRAKGEVMHYGVVISDQRESEIGKNDSVVTDSSIWSCSSRSRPSLHDECLQRQGEESRGVRLVLSGDNPPAPDDAGPGQRRVFSILRPGNQASVPRSRPRRGGLSKDPTTDGA